MISLTDFAVQLYHQPGIQALCLRWQDSQRADIPYVLFLCWYGRYFGNLSSDQASAAWHLQNRVSQQVVRPLRQVRRWMKTEWQGHDALRENVKSAELAAELALLKELEGLMAGVSGAGSQAGVEHNLQAYANAHLLRITADTTSQLQSDISLLASAALLIR